MKRILNHLIFLLLISSMLIACEKECPEAPLNLRNGGPDFWSTLCIYKGGVAIGMNISLCWDSISNATGYNLFIKNSDNDYELIETTSDSYIWVEQGFCTKTYVVNAFNDECESDYSNEFEIQIKQ